MQLISTFDQIFKIEQLKLQLTTYEVISLGPGYGLIEVVRDALSIDSIKKKLNDILQIKCLSQYFKYLNHYNQNKRNLRINQV